MKLEDQVCSLELAQQLKKLGVKQESFFHWGFDREYGGASVIQIGICGWIEEDADCSAFTVAELGRLLPDFTKTERYLCKGKERWSSSEGVTIENHTCHADTEADSKARLLIHLIEKGIVKV